MRGVFADWHFRLATFAVTIVATTIGIFLTLELADRNLLLTDPVISHHWILAAVSLCLGTVIIRFGFPSLPFTRLFARSAIPFVLTALKVAALAAGITVLTLAAFNPLAETRLYLFLDYNPNVGADTRIALAQRLLVERQSWLDRGGAEADIRYLPGDTPEIRQAVKQLAVSPEGALATKTGELGALIHKFLGYSIATPSLGTLILEALKGAVTMIEASGRAGDRLIVLSTWRSAPTDWALNVRRFASMWVQVGEGVPDESDRHLQVQSYEVAHYPGLTPILSILIRASAEVRLLESPPKLFLTDDGNTECVAQTGTSVPVNTEIASSAAGRLSTGWFEQKIGQRAGRAQAAVSLQPDRVQFVQLRIVLPTSGPQFACIAFPGTAGAEALFVRPIPIGIRQLQLAPPNDELKTVLRHLLGNVTAGDMNAPLVITTAANADRLREVAVFSEASSLAKVGGFDLVLLPETNRNQPSLWNLTIWPRAEGSLNLQALVPLIVRGPGLSDLAADFGTAPNCGTTSSVVIAVPQSNSDECREVLSFRGGRLTLRLPPSGDIDKLPEPQRNALRRVLVIAATIAWSNGGSPIQPVLSREEFGIVAAATETLGWTTVEMPLWKQLAEALWGNAEPRPAMNAANGARPRLMQLGLLLMALAAWIGLVRPLSLTVVRSRMKEGAQ